mgnify:CR=1 FL=1
MDRKSNVSRTTSETDIQIEMNLDGKGKYNISTGVNFFNHMLEAFSKHSMIDLVVDAKLMTITLLKMLVYCWVKLSGKLLEIKGALKEWLMPQYLWMSQ